MVYHARTGELFDALDENDEAEGSYAGCLRFVLEDRQQPDEQEEDEDGGGEE